MTCDAFDLACYFGYLLTQLQALSDWVVNSLLSGFASLIEALPVPSFLSQNSFTLPSSVLFFASALRLDYGLSVMVSAYTLRFVLRRIPGIG